METKDVRKQVELAVTPEFAFDVFTQHPSTWWPPHHLLLGQPRVGLLMEPGVGGRYYEWDSNGNEADWGTILEWNPSTKLRFTWRVGADFRPLVTDEGASEIEVLFKRSETGTNVELAHIKLDRLGDGAEVLRQALDGASPGDTLRLFKMAVDKLRHVSE